MSKHRRGRINDAVAEELAIALGNVREPRIVNNFVTITHAEVSPDLKIAKISFSTMGDQKEALEGLKKVTGMLRHHLATTLNLRITPDLLFQADNSIEHGAHIAKLLKQIEDDRARFAQNEEGQSDNGDEES
ncbi:MAG: 30S ribosome-binding factor RbfA [Clostridia bacterium]|jgi:ribosome-binding factor A|nr:30S ribosome-binding factor RbfA [Clostridia bacterium]MBQ5800394.1 30S ribosome-binding factor RbfA [Clostridia bacterium]